MENGGWVWAYARLLFAFHISAGWTLFLVGGDMFQLETRSVGERWRK